jgi:hypothetical protein
MALLKPFKFGPLALTTTLTTNILNPGTTTGGVNSGSGSNLFILLYHIHILNKTASAATFSLYLGATGANTAGTEFWGTASSVAANSYVDWVGRLPLYVADFLVGGAGTATALTIQGEGDIGVQ